MPRSTSRPMSGARDLRLKSSEPLPRPEHRQFVTAAHRLIAAGQRPSVRVSVYGIDGLLVQLAVDGMPGAIAHARTRRRAREIARASVASILLVDPYAFDLQVEGA